MATTGPTTAAAAHAHARAAAAHARDDGQRRRGGLKLAIAALGVVYGDIGTSPLYAFRECFTASNGVGVSSVNVFGVLSLIFWSLTLVVVVKYLTFVLRADNDGEGGILALLALLGEKRGASTTAPRLLALLGIVGAALLYGDGMITPAISVLSAVEGLGIATHVLDPFIVPVTVVLLVGLFLVQKRGTERVGRVFGPATFIWLATLVGMGLPSIARRPDVLRAIDPRHAVAFFLHHGERGFLILGAVVLCITGAEALYADMGHFGRRPIRFAWYAFVFPALLVNYFGQGALYLERGGAVRNPFYELVSGWVRYPVVAVATVATIVASQALISGVYSLTRQGIQLGYWPRMTVVHTSGATEGQIYMPDVNRALMVACIALVLGFESSSALAGAYGIAVTGTMAITTILFFVVSRKRHLLSRGGSVAFLAGFLVIDLGFFAANSVKLFEGGWFPIAIAAAVFTLMTTWKSGRTALSASLAEGRMPLDLFLDDVRRGLVHRIPGTGVFMTSNPDGVPRVLLHHVKHNRVLHEHVVLLSVQTTAVPEVAAAQRATVTELGEGFFQVRAQYGFMESPDVPEVLRRFGGDRFPTGDLDMTYYLGSETLLTTGDSPLARWRKRLFAIMSRNAQPATAFFNLPPNRVVELGTQLQL